MSHVDVLARVIDNCQKADDARRPIKGAWVVLPPSGSKSPGVDIVIETSLPLGKKWDLLTAELLEGLSGMAMFHSKSGPWDQAPKALIWKSRRL